MGANSSSAQERKTLLWLQQMVELEAEQKVRERADYRQCLFPIQSIPEDADPSPSFPQRHGKQTCSSYLALLPPEIIENMLTSLDNRSIKSLRLTCRWLGAIAALRINRVFLSANPLSEVDYRGYYAEDRHDMEWFESECDENLFYLTKRRIDDDLKRPEYAALVRRVHAELSPKESREYYRGLLRQQEEVMASGADADALRYGLQRFPALRKVTVTPATHGWLFTPLYETPMIRAFPYGFNCPLPRAWPHAGDHDCDLQVAPWEDEKTRWHGFNLVTKILAEGRHNVVEYEIDGHHLGTGLNCRIFDDRCNEYEDFVTVLGRPGFKKLRLSLFVDASSLQWSAAKSPGRGYTIGACEHSHRPV